MEDNMIKIMFICMCDWVILLYSRKVTEHCKPTISEKIKIIKKKKKRKRYPRDPIWVVLK